MIEKQGALESLFDHRICLEVSEWQITYGLPELISGINGGHMGQKASLAMPHYNHLLHRGILLVRVQLMHHAGQSFTKVCR